ncbi:iron-hydroxamate ABC transporter substrate-binding protein [Paenibacillus silvae]|uniref:iron-hydroxamate ABC transporter substrate-binding protein n=1 Tax=Paenibacillus silvae TaxID=1325358 RepID=UPI0020067B03|nr:iron-hydroxamate ABC transporter substrate-binding protein [Paenibacillus silvae]MCK6074316.1 iron-hydroxamate ABC transporter substrate-binding protein [Paenibacillus silvae]MCK6148206.1 iron-hydroxamate ABC transporter substrate-binding protein [Paenibacillus silvae]MCK6266506.1 iron-hydroxamate ABC transporter substrate-binding protein [Paenibacillus silvae]
MKKLFAPIILVLVVLLSACGGNAAKDTNDTNAAAGVSTSKTGSDSADADSGTFTYESESGPVEVPSHPQRVVVLTRFLTGNVMALDVPLVGVDEMSKENPNFKGKLENVEAVTDESLEKIIELNPDLIIGMSDIKNIDKLKQIAPTVTYTYGKVDFLKQQLEIGKLVNKEKEAQAWVDDFDARSKKVGEEIKAKIGDNATVSVIETFNKQLYVYGEKFGRGTEILYDQFGLAMPEKVKEATKKDGFFAVSNEVLKDYMGDYVIFSKNADEDNSFQNTETYKNIPAVKNNRVFEADAKAFYFNDPLSMEYQLEFFIQHFLGK